jgi:hypothetical protein
MTSAGVRFSLKSECPGGPASRCACHAAELSGASTNVEEEMPARKTKGKTEAEARTKVREEELAAADSAAASAAIETAAGAADVTHGEDEAAAAAAYSASSDEAALRGARDAAEGAATLSMADEVAAGGELAASLSSDEFRRGMELAGIAGQIQVAAELLGGIQQRILAAFLNRTSHQLRVLAVEALGRATEGAIVAHKAEHLAVELSALGRTEMGEGRDEYARSEAFGAASAEMATAAVRAVAAGAAELAAARAMGGMANALAHDAASGPIRTRGANRGRSGKTAAAVAPRPAKPAARPAAKRASQNPSRPKA